MTRVFAAILLLIPAIGRAQVGETTRAKLDRAIKFYEALTIESARPLLNEILAPGYKQQITPAERVEAFKYLGSTYAASGQRDSAAEYFVAALRLDAFTDLEVDRFGDAERNFFAYAKRLAFKIDIAQVRPKVVDPTSQKPDSALALRFVSTHATNLDIWLIQQKDTTQRIQLFVGSNDGVLSKSWQGLLQNGQRPDTGFYDIRMSGDSQVRIGEKSTVRQTIKIAHLFETLEDTIPPLNKLPRFGTDTLALTDQYKPSAKWADAGKSLFFVGITGGALVLALKRDDLGDPATQHGVAIAATGVITSMVAFYYRSKNKDISDAKAENARREEKRLTFNQAVNSRNEAKRAKTLLVITPLTVGR